MVSPASAGTADRIAARSLFKVLRAGSGTPARYSSTFFGAPLPFAAERRLPDFSFFMGAMLPGLPLQVHAPDHRAAVPMKNSMASSDTLAVAQLVRVPDKSPGQLSTGTSRRESRFMSTSDYNTAR